MDHVGYQPSCSVLPATSQPPPDVLVHRRATVIDGVSPRRLPDMTVVVRAGRIASVSPGPGVVPANARVIDLEGHWVLPGLIDAHLHLRDPGSARAALRTGITTVRSLGSPHFTDIGQDSMHDEFLRSSAPPVRDGLTTCSPYRAKPFPNANGAT